MNNELTAERLREYLSYDPKTGQFVWLKTRSNSLKAGDNAGWRRSDGYAFVTFDGKVYPSHRLAFFYMTGKWPVAEVDHRDGNPANDRWDNLREATRAQNNQNRRGIGVGKANQRWRAYIRVSGVQRHIGTFDTKEEAIAARNAVAKQAFGEFARVS